MDGNVEVTKMLLDKGANFEAVDDVSFPPVFSLTTIY